MAVDANTAAALPRLTLDDLRGAAVDPLTKGLPFDAPPLRLDDIGQQGWSLLAGDLPMPVAILKHDVLAANSRWMSRFTADNGLVIAPHGKTTMAPQLYDIQAADGAWAITVATAQQLNVCRRFGVKRVLFANQPVGTQSVAACLRALRGPDAVELYCLADTLEGVSQLAVGMRGLPPPGDNPLRVLVEIGFEGGRTGARSAQAALAVARTVAQTPGLVLAGFECFEGLLPDPDAAGKLVDEVVSIAAQAVEEDLVPPGAPIVLSAGGSSFFDRAGESLTRALADRPVIRVLRSGCYLTHDTLGYAASFRRILAETSLKLPSGGGLEPALEVWAHVQSRPEPKRAILTLGKRDAGFDAGMPVPLSWFRPDSGMTEPATIPVAHEVQELNDQHCHMAIPESSPLQVGDMVGFGIGHPCTTFDKWSLLMMVDDDYRVIDAVRTFF